MKEGALPLRLVQVFTVCVVLIALFAAATPALAADFWFPDEGIVPCGKDTNGDGIVSGPEQCTICHLGEMTQNLFELAWKTVAPIIAIVMVAIGGIVMITAHGNEKQYASGRKILINTMIGLAIVLSSYILVGFVMKAVFKEDISDKWYEFQCSVKAFPTVAPVTPRIVSGGVPVSDGPDDDSGGPPEGPPPEAGAIPAAICAAAQSYRGTNTAAGPEDGKKACAWAVNNVLRSAGLANIDADAVASMESSLRGGRGQQVAQSAAVCGDIIVDKSSTTSHVGICLNNGCRTAISNSSSRASFSWISGSDFSTPPNNDARFYRVTN